MKADFTIFPFITRGGRELFAIRCKTQPAKELAQTLTKRKRVANFCWGGNSHIISLKATITAHNLTFRDIPTPKHMKG